MYLSRLILNPRSRQVRSEIARPYQMHKTILRAFPEKLPSCERVLFRLEEDPRNGLLMLLVQSQHVPDWQHLLNGKNYLLPVEFLPDQIAENPSIKAINLQLHAGQSLSFCLYANPTRKVKVEIDGERKAKRVGIFKEEEQQQWLTRKLEAVGASILRTSTSQRGNIYALQSKDGQKNKLTLLGVRFEGVLQVMDPQALCQAVDNGIGSGKSLGFGLLSLAPYRG